VQQQAHVTQPAPAQCLLKCSKNALPVLKCNTNPRVFNGNIDLVGIGVVVGADRNVTLFRKFDSVADEIKKNLLKPIRIGIDWR
jgi:hypothetical protein